MDPRPYHFEYRKPRVSNPTYQSSHLYQSIYHLGSYSKPYPNIQKVQNRPSYQLPSTNRYNQRQQSLDQMINKRMRKIDPSVNEIRQGANNEIKNSYSNNSPKDYNYGPSNMERAFAQEINSQQSPRNNPQYEQPNKQSSQYMNGENIRQKNQELKDRKIQPRSYSQEVAINSKNQNLDNRKEPGYMSNYGSRLMMAMPGKDQDRVYENQQKAYNIISFYPSDGAIHRKYPKLTLQNRLIQTGQYSGQPRLNYNPQRY